MMTSGEHDPATPSRISFTLPQAAGSRPSGRSNNSIVRSAAGMNEQRRVPRLLLTLRGAREHDVADSQLALGQAEEEAPGADLDVVGVRADREHRQRPA